MAAFNTLEEKREVLNQAARLDRKKGIALAADYSVCEKWTETCPANFWKNIGLTFTFHTVQ